MTLMNSLIEGTNSVFFTIMSVLNAPSFSPPSKNISVLSQLNQIYNYSFGSAADNYLITINNLPSLLSLSNMMVFSSFELGAVNTLSVTINGDNL